MGTIGTFKEWPKLRKRTLTRLAHVVRDIDSEATALSKELKVDKGIILLMLVHLWVDPGDSE